MATDATQPLPAGPPPAWDLPEILDIQIRRMPFDPPKLRNFKSALAEYREVVEFRVQTAAPIPERAMGPTLFVGDVPVIESQWLEDHRYRFLAFDFERLRPGALISWGWINTPKEQRQTTRFRYEESQ